MQSASAIDPLPVVPSPVDHPFVVRAHRRVRLGPLRLSVRSNEPSPQALLHFPVDEDSSPEAPDHVLNLCNLGVDGPWPQRQLEAMRDRSYRAKRFATGYYITDHFGPPAFLITSSELWVFAEQFEQIVWPYFAKWLLTKYSVRHGMLHLKAAAVAVGGSGTLLIGRGGSGKTVLLTRLCSGGAEFLSNTHVLIDGDSVIAVPSAMRVRPDALFAPLIAARRLPEGIKPGEFIADPRRDLGWHSRARAPLRNLCLVDYRGPGQCTIEEIDRNVLFDYMEHFALALGAYYGLKEDLIDHVNGEIRAFSSVWSQMKQALRATVDRCRCHYISCDVMDNGNLDRLLRLLAAGN